MFSSWFRRSPRSRPRFLLHLESLEERNTLSTTMLTVAPSPGTANQPITLAATVTMTTPGDMIQPGTGHPTGTVTFFDAVSNTQVGTPATVTPSTTLTQGVAQEAVFLGPGTYSLYAKYSGESGGYLGSDVASQSNTVPEVVNAGATPPAPAPAPLVVSQPVALLDVTGLVSITPVKSKHHNPLSQHFTLRTVGGALQGPVFVVLRGLPARVTLKYASGTTTVQGHPGDPYLRLDVSQLAAGGSLDLMFSFSNPRHKTITFSEQVFAGSGTP